MNRGDTERGIGKGPWKRPWVGLKAGSRECLGLCMLRDTGDTACTTPASVGLIKVLHMFLALSITSHHITSLLAVMLTL